MDIPVSTGSETYSLTSLSESDVEPLTRLLNTPAIALNLISPPYPFMPADAVKFIEVAEKGDGVALPGGDRRRVPARLALRSPTGALIGTVGVGQLTAEHDVFRLGYFIDEAYAGRGIIYAVVRELVRLFRGARLRADVLLDNAPSERVLLKNGFVLVEGSLHQTVWPESKGGGSRPAYTYEKRC